MRQVGVEALLPGPAHVAFVICSMKSTHQHTDDFNTIVRALQSDVLSLNSGYLIALTISHP